MTRFWTVSVALLCLSGRAAAQDSATIDGRVLEFATDAPVAAVQVELLDSRQRRVDGAITDDAGAFRFTNVRPARTSSGRGPSATGKSPRPPST